MNQRYSMDADAVEKDARGEAQRNLQTGKITIDDVESLLNDYYSTLGSGNSDYYNLLYQAALIDEYTKEYNKKSVIGSLSKKEKVIYSRIVNKKQPDITAMKMKYKSLQYQTLNPGINQSVTLPNISRFYVYPDIKTVNEAIPVNRTGSGSNSDLSGSMSHSLTSSVSSTNSGSLTPMTSLNPAFNIDRINQPYQRNSFPLGSIYAPVVNNNTNNQRHSYNYSYSGDQQQLYNYQQQYNQQVTQSNQQVNQQQYNQQVTQSGQQQSNQQVTQSGQQQYNQQPSQQVNLRSSQQQYTQQYSQQQTNQQQTNQQYNQQQYTQQYNQQQYGNQQVNSSSQQQYNQQQYNQQQYNQQQYNQQQYNQQPGQQQQQLPISIDIGRSIYSPYASMYPSPPILYDKESILESFDFSKVPDYPKINFGITYEDSIRVSCIQ